MPGFMCPPLPPLRTSHVKLHELNHAAWACLDVVAAAVKGQALAHQRYNLQQQQVSRPDGI